MDQIDVRAIEGDGFDMPVDIQSQNAELQGIRLLRLRQGSRYIVALQDSDGLIRRSAFWTEVQTLTYAKVPQSRWHEVPTESFKAIYVESFPSDVAAFADAKRRGRIEAIVVWTSEGIHPRKFRSIREAAETLGLQIEG